MRELEEAPLCSACLTHRAVRDYSRGRIAVLAREAVVQFEQFDAPGTFGDDYKHRTLWDEYCHDLQEGPHNDLLEAAFAEVIDPVVQAIVGSIAEPEAILLTIGARWHLDEDHEVDGDVVSVPDLIRRNLQDAIKTLAILRDMSEFDPWSEH